MSAPSDGGAALTRADYRYLRVGEVMEESDRMFNCFGELIPIRSSMVGHKVLGSRYSEPDNVLRLRKRKARASAKGGEVSAATHGLYCLKSPKGVLLHETLVLWQGRQDAAKTPQDAVWGNTAFEAVADVLGESWRKKYYKEWSGSITNAKRRGYKFVKVQLQEVSP